MTTKRVVTLVLVANLLTVALVTAALQVTGVVQAGLLPFIEGNRAVSYDPSLEPIVPRTMNYQGVLKDGEGNPISGEHELTFTIYRWDVMYQEWVALWTEMQVVSLTDGLFNVKLGSDNPLDASIFVGLYEGGYGGHLELGIRVDGGDELTPRTPLLTVPYAFRAEYVNRFPKPHYDSGWMTLTAGQHKRLDHYLGGNVNDYVVDLTMDGGYDCPVNNQFYGLDEYGEGRERGAYWSNLSTSSIWVYRGANDYCAVSVRIRIWRID